jgi:hypothetical protein
MSIRHSLVVSIGIIGMQAASPAATVTLLDDFDNDTVGSPTPGWSAGSGGGTIVASNSTSYFEGSPDGVFARLTDNDGGSGGVAANSGAYSNAFTFADNARKATIVFDAWINDTAGGSGFDNSWNIGIGTSGWPSATRLRGAGIGDAPVLKTLTFSVLINRSGSAVNYSNPVTQTTVALADDDMVVFAYDADSSTYYQFNSSAGTLATTSTVNRLWFYHPGNAPGKTQRVDMGLDNLSLVEDSLEVVPEPSMLCGVGAGALLLRRRRELYTIER